MDYLIIGTKGSGKTNLAISKARQIQKRTNKKVYFCNLRINDDYNPFALGWEEITKDQLLDFGQWCPDECLLFVDELQDIFPSRRAGQPIPPFVDDFKKFRHRSIDCIFTTHNGTDIDKAIRTLCNNVQLIKESLAGTRNIYKWTSYHDTEKKESFFSTKCNKERHKLDKESFNYYESTVENTEKREIPALVKKIPLYLAVIGFIFYYAYNHFLGAKKDFPGSDTTTTSSPSFISGKKETAFISDFDPSGFLPQNPFYRATSKYQNTRYEIPEFGGCMHVSNECICIDKSARRLYDITHDICIEYLKDPFRPFTLKQENKEINNNVPIGSNFNNQHNIRRPITVSSSVAESTYTYQDYKGIWHTIPLDSVPADPYTLSLDPKYYQSQFPTD